MFQDRAGMELLARAAADAMKTIVERWQQEEIERLLKWRPINGWVN
jgi:hypothetical protein